MKTFEQRIQSIENELKDIRKELEESLARYKQSQYPFVDGYIREIPKITYDFPEFKLWDMETKCLWDSIPVEDRMKPMGLSCPCRKCSAYC